MSRLMEQEAKLHFEQEAANAEQVEDVRFAAVNVGALRAMLALAYPAPSAMFLADPELGKRVA